jgi:hypothetical protein
MFKLIPGKLYKLRSGRPGCKEIILSFYYNVDPNKSWHDYCYNYGTGKCITLRSGDSRIGFLLFVDQFRLPENFHDNKNKSRGFPGPMLYRFIYKDKGIVNLVTYEDPQYYLAQEQEQEQE